MTDTEINRRLALAIGYLPDHVASLGNHVKVWRGPGPINGLDGWKLFDHTDYRVAGPIAERYGCFPYKFPNAAASLKWMWAAHAFNEHGNICRFFAPTPQRAIALAAIAQLEKS